MLTRHIKQFARVCVCVYLCVIKRAPAVELIQADVITALRSMIKTEEIKPQHADEETDSN